MDIQNKIGSVHLATKGLDRDRFLKLCEHQEIYDSVMIADREYHSCKFIENWNFDGYAWLSTNTPDADSLLITLDELEALILS